MITASSSAASLHNKMGCIRGDFVSLSLFEMRASILYIYLYIYILYSIYRVPDSRHFSIFTDQHGTELNLVSSLRCTVRFDQRPGFYDVFSSLDGGFDIILGQVRPALSMTSWMPKSLKPSFASNIRVIESRATDLTWVREQRIFISMFNAE